MRWTLVAAYAGFGAIVWFGGWLGWMGVQNAWRAAASTEWPKTGGEVVRAEVGHTRSTDSRTKATSTTHTANITVNYSVAGRRYETRILKFGALEGSEDETEAELLMLQYPVGAKVSVSHHPDDPGIACVSPGFHAEALMLPGSGLAIMTVGSMFFLVFLGSKGKPAILGGGVALFATIFCLLGLAMLVPGLMNLWRAHTSENWPIASGRIVYGKESSSEVAVADAKGFARLKPSWSAQLIYEYEADGAKRYGNRRRFGQIAGADAEWADEIMQRYPLGKPVQVRHAPDQPDLAVLEPGLSGESFWLPGAGAAFFLFGLAAMFVVVPQISKPFP